MNHANEKAVIYKFGKTFKAPQATVSSCFVINTDTVHSKELSKGAGFVKDVG